MARKNKDDGSRLMSLPELASYLHVSERTALRLATSQKVPGVLVERQWRFKRELIDAWLEQQLTGESEDDFEDVPDGMRVPLGDLLPEEAIIVDMRAKDALGAIEELAARAYSAGWLNDKPWFVGAVVERESLASTAMEGGVAFLHTRARDMGKIARPFIIVGRSHGGIDFGAPDDAPTYLFFLLGLKYDRLHLPILGRLARALRNPKTIARLRSLAVTTKIRARLLEEDAKVLAAKGRKLDYASEKPKLDKDMRLRKIMRLQAQRRYDEKKREAAAKKTKAPAKKTAAKKTAAKKTAAKKTAAKKTPAKKTPAKKTPAKKTAAKKTAAKKTAAKKTAAKKTTSKKATSKKATSKKATSKKATSKKATAKKTTPKRSAKKTVRSKT